MRWGREQEPEPELPEEVPTSFNWGLAPSGSDAPAEAAEPPEAEPAIDPAPTQAWTPEPSLDPAPSAAPGLDPAPTAEPEPTVDPAPTQAWTPPALIEPSAGELPTQAMAWQAPALDAELGGVAELFQPEPLGADTPVAESLPPSDFAQPSALDELFGEAQFQAWDDVPAASGELVRQPLLAPGGGKPPRAPISTAQRVLMWVAGGLAAAIVLIGLFVLGTRLGPLSPPPDAAPTAPVDTGPQLPATGPLPAGTWAWDQLRGGECLHPFESAWQDEYTVVDCASPHAAQLLARVELAETPASPYPGFEELEARAPELCTAPTVVDYTAAAGLTDLEVLPGFAADQTEWNEGQRELFCFAHRSTGEPLTVSLAAAEAAPQP